MGPGVEPARHGRHGCTTLGFIDLLAFVRMQEKTWVFRTSSFEERLVGHVQDVAPVMSKWLRLIVIPALALAVSCRPVSSDTSQTAEMVALDPPSKLVVGTKLNDRIEKEVAISGRERVSVPDTDDWSCGHPLGQTYVSNVGWIELVNPSDDTLSLSVEVSGLSGTHPSLFLYERKDVPLAQCLTFALDRRLAGASSVVLEPTSAAYVLVSAGAATGVYSMAIKTEHIISP